jgi:hypothetical protein
MKYDEKTDKLLDEASDTIEIMSPTELARAALALLDQAGCSVKCQNDVRKLVTRNLEVEVSEPMPTPPPIPPMSLALQMAEEAASKRTLTSANLNKQGVRDLDQGRQGPRTSPNDYVPGSMASSGNMSQASKELADWKKVTEQKQKEVLQRRGRS